MVMVFLYNFILDDIELLTFSLEIVQTFLICLKPFVYIYEVISISFLKDHSFSIILI